MMISWIRRHMTGDDKRGQTLVIFALIFVTLVGFAGLALDATHLYLAQHTAQKAADAAALAAGKRLAGATQQSPMANSNDLALVAAHDFAAGDGFITTRSTACDTTVTSGSITRFTATWTDGASCSSSTYTNKVSVAVPPYTLTPHCQVTPYNCMQVTVQSKVTNFVMGTAGIPTSLVQASATVYAQPSGTTFDYPYPVAVYLYQPAVALIATCPAGQQCFDRTKVPARTLLSCSTAGSNCPTYWARPEASNLIVGVDGTTLNPPQDVVALESNGDMVLQGALGDQYCDPYGVGAAGCTLGAAIGSKGYALAAGSIAYCATSGGAGTRAPTPCISAGPGGTSTTRVYGNETTFASHTWTPTVDTSGLRDCGYLLLNGNTVASGLSTSTCAPPSTEPYTIMPGIYQWIAINHGAYTFEPGIYDITGKATRQYEQQWRLSSQWHRPQHRDQHGLGPLHDRGRQPGGVQRAGRPAAAHGWHLDRARQHDLHRGRDDDLRNLWRSRKPGWRRRRQHPDLCPWRGVPLRVPVRPASSRRPRSARSV